MVKNKISEIPKSIALFLNLPTPERYTGHSFRRTSATLLANSGASLTTIKTHGGWRSSTVAEGYIENSLGNKMRAFEKIVDSKKLSTPTVSCNPVILPHDVDSEQQSYGNTSHVEVQPTDSNSLNSATVSRKDVEENLHSNPVITDIVLEIVDSLLENYAANVLPASPENQRDRFSSTITDESVTNIPSTSFENYETRNKLKSTGNSDPK